MGTPEDIPFNVWRAFRSSALWTAASDEAVERLARASKLRDYSEGERIFAAGQQPGRLCLVVSGQVRSVYHAPDGHATVVEALWPGAVLGSIEALGECPFVVDVEAAEDVEVCCFPLGVVTEVMRAEPVIAMSVIRDFADRWIRIANVLKMSSEDVRERVAHYIGSLHRTEIGPNCYAVVLPTSRVELAAVLGAAPESLMKAFHSLQNEGIISDDERLITVLNAWRLDTEAPGGQT